MFKYKTEYYVITNLPKQKLDTMFKQTKPIIQYVYLPKQKLDTMFKQQDLK